MEDYNMNPNSINAKEKNIYLLQLNAPRVIILVSAIIGIIIITFLIGMNYSGNDNSKKIGHNSIIIDEPNGLDLLKRKIPPIQDDTSIKSDDVLISENNSTPDKTKNIISKRKNGTMDIVTNDNINEIIPNKKTISKKTSIKKIAKKKKISKYITKRKKRTYKKNQRIIPVSLRKQNKKSINSSHYTIQIASYDKRFKANSEVQKLRSMKFDAHVKKTTINGKRYYRVRIGPLFSKRKSINLLKKIQRVSRYEDSYMTRQ